MPVYDLSYRPWEGKGEAGRRFLPIFRESLFFAFRTRWLKLLYAAAWAPCLIVLVMKFVQYTIASQHGAPKSLARLGEQHDQEFFFGFLIAQTYIMALLAAFVGPALVAEDRRANALELVLSRPITRADYVLGKASALIAFLMSVTFAPALVLWLFDGIMDPAGGRFEAYWDWPHKTLAHSLTLCAGTGLFVLAIGSMSRSTGMGMTYWLAWFFTTAAVGEVIYEVTQNRVLTMISYGHLYQSVGRAIFGFTAFVELPHWGAALAVIALLSALSLGVLFQRLRGSEVFK